VAALYAQGKVRHVGQFVELERQYCLFSTGGYMGARSPDRADAAIWGLTELMLDPEPQPNIRFPDISGYGSTNQAGFRRPTSPY
jgi:phage terminase large subunit-like protein